jgi:hypothetical protein
VGGVGYGAVEVGGWGVWVWGGVHVVLLLLWREVGWLERRRSRGFSNMQCGGGGRELEEE